MSEMIRCIQANIENLRFSIDFDIYEFSTDQREAMLHRLDQIQMIVENVKSKRK